MSTKNEILIYNLPDGTSNVEVYLAENDMWMTQAALSELFQTTKANITMHIQNIYKEGELLEERTSKLDLLLRNEGSRTVKRAAKLYNLKMIIAIGMRVKSSAATSFRKWANNIIEEYIIKDIHNINWQSLWGIKIIPH